MFSGYLAMGCNEILSRARAYGYATTADCPIGWFRIPECGDLATALDEEVYNYDNIEQAPWFDAEDPVSARFFGAYPTKIDGVTDSTRTATIIEGILDGGVVSGLRYAVRTFRCEAVLVARGEDALEYGMSWLDAALRAEECGTHGSSCGEVDATFFVSCPEPPLEDQPVEEYAEYVDSLIRVLHGVVAVSGPLVARKLQRDDVFGYIVEFTLAATTPFVYTLPTEVPLPQTTPVVVQDSPVNLVPYPSAELGSGSVVVATNYSLNPSVETNTTGWTGEAFKLPTAAITGATVTPSQATAPPDIAAVGTHSFKVALLGNNGGAGAVASQPAYIQAYQDIDLSALPAGSRVSVNAWGGIVISAGTAPTTQRTSLRNKLQFLTAGNVQVGADIVLDAPAGTLGGHAFQHKSLAIPATATKIRSFIVAEVVYTSSATAGQNSNLQLFADALAVTVP